MIRPKCGASAAPSGEAVLASVMEPIVGPDEARTTARHLIQRFGSLARALRAEHCELGECAGTARLLKREFERVLEIAAALARDEVISRPTLDRGQAVLAYLRSVIGGSPAEQLYALYLDCDYRLVGERLLQSGTVNHVTIYPREILRHALILSATRIVLAHNHPSGNSQPSAADRRMTRHLQQLAGQMGIDIADHLIIGAGAAFSFRKNGLLEAAPAPAGGISPLTPIMR